MSKEIYKTLIVRSEDIPFNYKLAERSHEAYFVLVQLRNNLFKIKKNKREPFFGNINSIKELEKKYNCICLVSW